MGEIAWDLELLQTMKEDINQLSKDMESLVSELCSLKQQTSQDWESEAGIAYSGRIDGDITELNDLCNQLNDLYEKLGKIRKKYKSVESACSRINKDDLLDSIQKFFDRG